MTSRFVLVICAVLGEIAAYGQTARKPEFEVASIRPASIESEEQFRQSYMPTLDVPPGGTLRITNRQLRDIIMLAFNVGPRQLSGPEWLVDNQAPQQEIPRFDVVAKVPEGAKKEEIALMLQSLLEERFKLKTHRDQKTIQVYALEIGKNGEKGLKLDKAVEGDRRTPGCNRTLIFEEGVSAAAQCQSVTMAQLAQQLQSLAPAYFREGPIVDRTGLTGQYDFRVEWVTIAEKEAGAPGPTMFEAVQKLGLNLDKRKDTSEILVIDRAEQMPTEN
jgi:uncharacterized protein (TIGR03435 family)